MNCLFCHSYFIFQISFILYTSFHIFQVVSEFQKRKLDFVLQAINRPTYLEDLTGLTELMKSASSFELDWDNETDDDDDCVEI